MTAANDNRPQRPDSLTRQRTQMLPVLGRLDAETGQVSFDQRPVVRARVRAGLRVVTGGGEGPAPT